MAEAALDPAIPICDSHHHFWMREEPMEYGGHLLPETYRPVDLLRDAGGHTLTSSVFVECSTGYRTDGRTELAPVGETEWVAHQVGESDLDTVIVGFADLTTGDALVDVLEAHVAAAGGRFRGVRHSVAWDADPQAATDGRRVPPGLIREPSFTHGLAVLEQMDLSFDAWAYFPQLGEVADTADQFPGLRIILNHLGGPLGVGPYRSEIEDQRPAWWHALRPLAERPSIYLKLGGIGMPKYGLDWHTRSDPPGSEEIARVWGPHLLRCIELFGPGRCLFESNYPVDGCSIPYANLWNAFKIVVRDLSPGERDAVLRGTAESVYRIGAPGAPAAPSVRSGEGELGRPRPGSGR